MHATCQKVQGLGLSSSAERAKSGSAYLTRIGAHGLAELCYLKPSSPLVALTPASQCPPLLGPCSSLLPPTPPPPLEKQDIFPGEELLEEFCFTETPRVACYSNVASEQATPLCE